MRRFCILLVLLYVQSGFSQEYPFWFLFEREVACGQTAAGFVNIPFYKDSGAALAFRQACEALAKQSGIKIAGGQSFWATEAGTYWMGTDLREEFDTSRFAEVRSHSVGLDTMAANETIFVLVGQRGCALSDLKGKTFSVAGKDPPRWTQTLPRDGANFYAVGIAPRYFYETSSWTEAERAARRNLARSVFSSVKSLQKQDEHEGQDVRHEELSVVLREYQVVARWRDLKAELFYVLVSMPVE